MRTTALLTMSLLIVVPAGSGMAQDSERKLSMTDLPPAVQRAVEEQSKGATVVGLSQEVEEGVTRYEARIRADDRSKDVLFEADGEVAAVEEKTALAEIPAPAREAITRAAGKGTVVVVETITEHGTRSYEAQVRNGQTVEEIMVDASGKPVR